MAQFLQQDAKNLVLNISPVDHVLKASVSLGAMVLVAIVLFLVESVVWTALLTS